MSETTTSKGQLGVGGVPFEGEHHVPLPALRAQHPPEPVEDPRLVVREENSRHSASCSVASPAA
jgi:hypothetical protein